MNAPMLPDEEERIAEILKLGILDSPAEERFDRITRIALHSFNVPIALISAVDVDRQWFKSCQGMSITETPRSMSFCAHAILGNDVMVVPDTLSDPRFSGNPLVTGDPYVRFYAGQPLMGPHGHKIGTLCIIDRMPRHFSEADRQALKDLAAVAQQEMTNVELWEALTSRRELDREVRDQAALLDLANEAIFVREIGTSAIRFWNHGAEDLYGWSSQEALGQVSHHLLQTIFPEPMDVIESKVATLGRWDGELQHTTRAGRKVVVASRWALQRDDRDQPVAVLVTNSDITARKQAEDDVRHALDALQAEHAETDNMRSTYRAVLDASGDAMVLVSHDRRFVSMNRRFSEIFGVRSEDLEGRSWDEVQDLVTRIFANPEDFAASVSGSSADEESQFTQVVVQRWPEQRELELCSNPVRGACDSFLGRLFVFRDVTHERAVERLKDEFVALVSHELRTPLTSIGGYVELLLDGEVGEFSNEQQEFLQIVKSNTDRLVLLVNDLLDVSRINSGTIHLRLVPLDLASLIHDVARSFRPQIEEKEQRLTVSLEKKLPHVCADLDRTLQILTNLVSNAHAYTGKHGHIAIRADRDGDYLRVQVEDTGVGLSTYEQSHIFDKFYRARNRMTQKAGGTGLGLTITRSLVEMQGGEIGVSSSPGKGSTFSFTLPILDQVSGTCPSDAHQETLTHVHG
ncbi:MAG: hypothetical protein NVS4B2_15210 [Chloroflexota bacterium]